MVVALIPLSWCWVPFSVLFNICPSFPASLVNAVRRRFPSAALGCLLSRYFIFIFNICFKVPSYIKWRDYRCCESASTDSALMSGCNECQDQLNRRLLTSVKTDLMQVAVMLKALIWTPRASDVEYVLHAVDSTSRWRTTLEDVAVFVLTVTEGS